MNLWYRCRTQAFSTLKELYQLTRTNGDSAKKILFIIGCQRSGTTLMTRMFHRDWDAKVYYEDSSLSFRSGGERLRLKPLPVIEDVFRQERFPLIVLKPLVETQNALNLLDYFPNSKAVWMYRHYQDVATSYMRRFGQGNGITDLRYIVENQTQYWLAENLPDWVRQIVLDFFSETMKPSDAAALFWYVRNTFYFELGLDRHPNVITCKYDDLMFHPKQAVGKIYDFIQLPYPGDHILKVIEYSSAGKSPQTVLSKEIENLCEQLWKRLEKPSNLSTGLDEKAGFVPAEKSEVGS